MKKSLLTITLSVILYPLSVVHAAVPLRWTVETSRVQPVTFEAVHGETLDLQADFTSYGKALQLGNRDEEIGNSGGTFNLFYQTNGMGSAWWALPASVASNRVTAVFAATNDPGAAAVNCFLGSAGSIYRAAFTLRFRHGPGIDPCSVVPNQVKLLDYATITVTNAPYYTTSETDAKIVAATNATLAAAKAYTDTEKAKYLPLSAGESKPLTGNLYLTQDFYLEVWKGLGDMNVLSFSDNSRGKGSPLIADDTYVLTEGLLKSTYPIVTNAYTKGEADAATNATLAAAKAYTDYEKSKYLPLTGGELSGSIGWSGSQGNTFAISDCAIYVTGADPETIYHFPDDSQALGVEQYVASREWTTDYVATATNATLAAAKAYAANAGNITSGTLAAARLPKATAGAVGAVKPDGTTITVDSSGTISAVGGGGASLTGKAFDFGGGTNFVQRVYANLTNVIQTLGGTVANPPAFE